MQGRGVCDLSLGSGLKIAAGRQNWEVRYLSLFIDIRDTHSGSYEPPGECRCLPLRKCQLIQEYLTLSQIIDPREGARSLGRQWLPA